MTASAQRVVNVVGAGLAGSEAAWQLANQGIHVQLYEMKPATRSAAHKTDGFAELVCSNSFGSTNEISASGLLKKEVQLLDSLILKCAQANAVPAGQALAVDRLSFSQDVTNALQSHHRIKIIGEEVDALNLSVPTIVATGPLTTSKLTKYLRQLIGDDLLYFYDAIAPVIAADTIDLAEVFFGSRYGNSLDDVDDDYLNIPLSQEAYASFVQELKAAGKVTAHGFEEQKYFEACLPIDVLAERGDDTLAFGPLKPVGFRDPKTGRRPAAVIQLRRENSPTTMYSMVGCQNRLKWPEQKRIFRNLPGLAEADFVRLGSLHRNTYIKSPGLVNWDMSVKGAPNLYFAGQVSGVEGYLESTASGLAVGRYCAMKLLGRPLSPLPTSTMLGALLDYVYRGPQSNNFQPMNSNFALLPVIDSPPGRKNRWQRRALMVERATRDILHWFDTPKPIHYDYLR